jgi:hypothetical protein
VNDCKNLIYVARNDRRVEHLLVVTVDVTVHNNVARQLADLHHQQAGKVQLEQLVLRDDFLPVVFRKNFLKF